MKMKKICRGHYTYLDYELINMPSVNDVNWTVYKNDKKLKAKCSYLGGRWFIIEHIKNLNIQTTLRRNGW